MSYKGLVIDDLESAVYAETLSTPDTLDFISEEISEVAVLANKIAIQDPLIVAIDYRLDESAEQMKPDQTYKGSALAQHLRDTAVEHPEKDFALVLVSAEGKIKKLFRPDKTAHDLFDRVYVKEEINKDRDGARMQMISLCAGYEKLRGSTGHYDLVKLMAGNDDDRPYLDFQELRTKLQEAAAPHVVSRVLFELIDRPGLLLGANDVFAYLGIAINNDILKSLNKIGLAYDGIFADAWPRWWTNRLEVWAQSCFERRPTGLPASLRAQKLSEKLGINVEPARSPWNGSSNELIAFACICCRRGAELRHSVTAFEATQPRYVKRRRICWDCIQTDQYEAAGLVVDDADRELSVLVKGYDREISLESPIA